MTQLNFASTSNTGQANFMLSNGRVDGASPSCVRGRGSSRRGCAGVDVKSSKTGGGESSVPESERRRLNPV